MKKSILHIAVTFLTIVNPLLPLVSKAQFTKLLDFNNIDGKIPNGSLISDGTFLYGMTWIGGTRNLGTIFKMKPDGNGYAKLLDFDSTNGSNPIGSLISDGIFLYGMTRGGGTHNDGVVFKIKTDGTAYTNLHNFAGSYGHTIFGASLLSDGTYLYGTTPFGGTSNEGTIFKLKNDGSSYNTLFNFNPTKGHRPYGSLTSDGTFFYGMTHEGGTNNKGVIFKINHNGTGYAKLLDFSGIANGESPFGDLTFDGTFLYGMTTWGGIYNNSGIIFKIKPDGTAYSKLLDFANDTIHGAHPVSGLFSDGQFLYGMTWLGGLFDSGVLFKIKKDGTGYVKLMDFSDWTTGSVPLGSVISDGTFLYGMTTNGGMNLGGTVFKYCITPVTFTQSPVVCAGESVIVGTHTYTAPGRYIDRLTSHQGCDSIIVTHLKVNPLPTIIANANATSVCFGTLVALTGEGATTYTWTGGVTDRFKFIPSSTTTYMVTGTDTNNCSNTATITINVDPLPQVSIMASDTAVCAGSSVTLTGVGASSYTWTQGITNGIGFVPSYSTTYTVIGTNANTCSDTATINVIVNPLPSVTVSANTTSVCAGTAVIFAGEGAVSYTWSGGITDGVGFIPTSTNTYTVIGTDTNNCSNTATKNINVNPLPTVTANASATTICAGAMVVFAGGGASSYSWSGGITDSVGFAPPSSTTYTVTGSDTNNCSNTATININVNPLPSVTANASATSVCVGTSVVFGSAGASSYTWSGGITEGIGFVPPSTTTYSVTGTDTNNCSNTATININVYPFPTVTANASATSVCKGTIVEFAGGGASSYTWSSEIIDGIGFVPSSTATYTVTGTDANNCSNTATTTISVTPLPDLSTTSTGINISANQNGAVYQWLDCNNDNSSILGAIDQSYTAIMNGVYSVIVSINGCSDTSKHVTVNTMGINEIVNSTNQLIIFPNPGNGSLTITLSGVEGQSTSDGVYTIMNESGQQIQLFELNSGNKFTINIEDLSNGIYFIVGFNNDQMKRQKVVVLK